MPRASTRRATAINGNIERANESKVNKDIQHAYTPTPESGESYGGHVYADDELSAARALVDVGSSVYGIGIGSTSMASMASTSQKGARKRKRGMSVSVAAVARGHVNGVEHTEEEWEQLSEPPAQSQSQPPTQAQTPAQSQSVEPHLSGETAVNGTATREQRKSTPKNFDKVNFGQWQIKTWYYSPYPLASVEEEEMSGVAGSSRHGMTGSSARGNHAKRGAGRGRARVPDVRSSNEGSILWVCDRCFKYMREGSMLELHSKTCQASHPPGRKVYGRGAHVIWEVDGAKEKLFCQNLSLFGKLFIDIKTLFFDCENFMFYLLTEGESQRDHVIGFFSKEKVSYDGYNLACIVTFPPYQRKRYGMLMIEFSYELSRRAGKLGTPERPLSELGLRSYLTFWTGAMVQFFRRILSVRPAVDARSQNNQEIDEDLIRFVAAQQVNGRPRKRRKSISNIEAWEGGAENMYHSKDVIAATSGANDVLFSRMRWMRTTANADGSVTTHVFARCTLEDISRATGLRIEDVAFTLHECGLLQRIRALDSEEMEEVIVISREMVEQIAEEFNVKKMCMEIKYVLV